MATSPAPATRLERRRAREDRILDASRALLDERGVADARVDAIARAAGIDKALIYRHFSSKEELHLLTLGRWLDELAVLLDSVDAGAPPAERLRACAELYAGFCLAHPAFVDVSLSVLRRPAQELHRVVSEAAWLRLRRSMDGCLEPLRALLTEGDEQGAFAVADPSFTADHLYAQVLGTVHLARTGIDVDRVREACVAAALATVR